jgi:PIN domain nuclease of toxin-antitoxin system
MKYLLDTCTYIWILDNDKKNLSKKTLDLIFSDNSTTYVSIISQIEMTIKHSKKQIPNFTLPIINYFQKIRTDAGIELLSLAPEDINHLGKLPQIHKDPFDRLLIAQAISNNMTIISPDKKLQKYPVKVEF